MRAAQKACIRWGSDRRQRSRQWLREVCLDTRERFSDPKYRADMEYAIGADAVSTIIRTNEEMLSDLGVSKAPSAARGFAATAKGEAP